MNEPIQESAPPPETAPGTPTSSPPRPLTAALLAAGDAVQDELSHANRLAGDLDAQLAGKSKEVLHLKFVLERTKAHFGHLQDSVTALRKERHQLANDVMKAQGLGMMLSTVTAERDRLKTELNAALQTIATQKAPATPILDQRDQTIADLTFELVKLRQEMADLRRANPGPASPVQPPVQPSAEGSAWEMAKLEIVPTERFFASRGKR